MRARITSTSVVAGVIGCAALLLALAGRVHAQTPLPALKVADNKRFLITTDGRPFFWLGDTAWELFHRLNREEADRYLKNRAERRFTVVQAVVLAELDGLNDPNPYGDRPLAGNDPTRPNEAYFAHVDWIVSRANALGIYVGMLPTWGDKWNRRNGAGPEIFTVANAEAYGEWLGRRYKNAGIVWIVGGDRQVESSAHIDITRAMARGLRRGDGGAHLITFHPTGGNSSSTWFHNDDWLDFNMRQNGHVPEFTGRYDMTRVDYDRTPVKPVLDGEPIYEDHPVAFDAKRFGHSIAADVRRPLYWNLFTGAFGHTYGHHSVWQESREQSVDAVVRGHRSTRRRTDATCTRAARVAAVPHPHSRSRHRRHQRSPDERAWHRTVLFRGHSRRRRQLRDGLCARGAHVQRKDDRRHRTIGEGVVVQPAQRHGHGDWNLSQHG